MTARTPSWRPSIGKGVLLLPSVGGVVILILGCRVSAPSLASCETLAASGLERVRTVEGRHLACESDEDCRTAFLVSSCFDGCSAPVNASGLRALDRVTTLAETYECKAFRSQGCELIHPPCAPLAQPACVERVCQ